MHLHFRILPVFLALTLAFAAPLTLARPADAVSESVLALAGPLAEQFGLPASAVTGLLEGGVSLESVTQLLLVQQSSGTSLDSVTKLFHEQGDSVSKTADELGVSADTYSSDNVQQAIADARAKATQDATDAATDKTNEAAGGALDAIGGALGK